ncbi:DUF4446 family protein [Streptomonospora litoralis]|uniref:DUF4446 domain-containing protein n=1 Tax=Streptomonospora litoralis TaxID=2498135 RepID=A0A4P6PZG6_9ACTN|nr:DUF4446 family protein [Streptomonospora litoralis]QBI51909.1 hypothetical protein EKD16_00435 [Streptomonospora litoralis]
MVTTLTTSLVVFAALAGLTGLALGAYALLRTRAVVADCRALVHRLLPDGSGLDARAVRDVAVVRYDALEEMSGARSFSLALLNAAGDGVVVTSINGRTESRTYAKTIEQGRAEEALSPEEYRAIRAARLGQGPNHARGDEPAAAPAPRSGGGTEHARHRAEQDGDGAQSASADTGASTAARDDDTAAVRPLGAAPSGPTGASD